MNHHMHIISNQKQAYSKKNLLTKTYVVVTQKNSLNEKFLWSMQNIFKNLRVRNYLQLYPQKFSLFFSFVLQMRLYGGPGSKKASRDPTQPKRPLSGYFLFLADFRVKMADSNMEHKEILKLGMYKIIIIIIIIVFIFRG